MKKPTEVGTETKEATETPPAPEYPVYARGTAEAPICGNCGSTDLERTGKEAVYSGGTLDAVDLPDIVIRPSQQHVGNDYTFKCRTCEATNILLEQWAWID